jgi:DNA invertase Pin-like site-specific DNA recombinase
MLALMARYEAALIKERTVVGPAAARARGRRDGRNPKMIPELVGTIPIYAMDVRSGWDSNLGDRRRL